MKKIYFTVMTLAAVILCPGCSEEERLMFEELDAVYFRIPDPNEVKDESITVVGDTIIFTFAYFDEDLVQSREIQVPLEIAGFPADRERKYHIEVAAKSNTVAGIDYTAPDKTQPFGANTMFDSLRVTFHRTKSMQSEYKEIEITITDGGDFIKGVNDNLHVVIKVSDTLEKPVWWNNWSSAFGPWHPTKLREWLKIWGPEPLSSTAWIHWMFTPQECMAITRLKDVFELAEAEGRPFLDENGEVLTIPAIF